MRVAVCTSQVPYSSGGAEHLAESLHRELCRRGMESELVRIPFAWIPRTAILRSALATRLLSICDSSGNEPDLIIATRFPSYLIRHPRKVVWLVHQFRQVYDLLGTPYSDFDPADPADSKLIAGIERMDRRAFGEARALFTISGNVAERLRASCGFAAQALHPPSPLAARLRPSDDPAAGYLLSVARLEPLKRVDLLIRALAKTDDTSLEGRIVGEGPAEAELRDLARRLGVAGRVHFLGRVDEESLLDLYRHSLAVFYAPFDEDYGYVATEAGAAGKALVTTRDAGGVLEQIVDGDNGLVTAPEPTNLAAAIDRLRRDDELRRRLGDAGRRRSLEITWDRVVSALTATVSAAAEASD